MWQWRSEHNYLEKEQNLSLIVICYNVLHCTQKAASTLVLEYYEGLTSPLLNFFSYSQVLTMNVTGCAG
jgi:hypothetical protein